MRAKAEALSLSAAWARHAAIALRPRRRKSRVASLRLRFDRARLLAV